MCECTCVSVHVCAYMCVCTCMYMCGVYMHVCVCAGTISVRWNNFTRSHTTAYRQVPCNCERQLSHGAHRKRGWPERRRFKRGAVSSFSQ